MKQPDNAPGQSKRADEPPGASPKSDAVCDHQDGTAKPRADKLSIEQFSRLLGGGIPLTTIRRTLIGAGLDLADGIEPMQAAPIIVAKLLEQLARAGLDVERDKARSAAAAADTAEIQLEKLQAGLVSRAEMQRVMENVVATYRAKIHDMADLSLEQRKAVCDLLVNLELDDAGEPPVGRRDVNISVSLRPSRCIIGGV